MAVRFRLDLAHQDAERSFRFMMYVFVMMLPLIFVMQKPQKQGGPLAAH